MPLRLNSNPGTDRDFAYSKEARNERVFDYTSKDAESAIEMINLF